MPASILDGRPEKAQPAVTFSASRSSKHAKRVRQSSRLPDSFPGSLATRELQLAELQVFVEALADARPFPLRALPSVIVHAIEVGAPARARLGRNILQWL